MTIVIMEQKRIKVRLTENSPYSDYGYYEKGDVGYIDGYVNDNAVIILENGKFVKADLRWIEVVNEEDKNVNTVLKESEDERVRQFLIHEIEEASDSFMSYYNMSKKDVLAWLEKQGEQNNAWSEEDEKEMATIEHHLNNCGASITSILWLKSLKDRYTWKPSEEQVRAIDVVRGISNRYSNDTLKALESLYQDLKKLREE